MSVRHSLVVLVWAVSANAIVSSLATPTADGQSISATTSAQSVVLGTYTGEEPSFKDDEGELTGPVSFVFHLLPNGRAFMDFQNRRTGKSGRTFGIYTIVSNGKTVTLEAQFVPTMDSLAIEPPATDYFSAYSFRFSDHKVTARYMEDEHAPAFLVSKARFTQPASTAVR